MKVIQLSAAISRHIGNLGLTKIGLHGTILAACLGSSPAAWSEFQEASGLLEEIVVTARKREESLQDTPISITAFGADDLASRQLDSIDQISDSTPNLVFSNSAAASGSSASTTVFIRGVGQLDHTLNVESGVGIYVDGVYVSRSTGSLIDLLDTERVEVLRGPQGTLFGRNTTGGAISITSKQPHENFEAKVGVTAGEFNRLDTYASVNFALTDTLFNRTSLKSKTRDGHYTRLQDGADIADVESLGGKTAFRWEASSNVGVDLSFDGTRERQGSGGLTLLAVDAALADPSSIASLHNAVFAPLLDPSVAQPFGPMGPPSACLVPGLTDSTACYNEQWLTNSPYDTTGTTPSRSELDLWGASATVTWELDSVTLKSITAFREVDSRAAIDIDQTPLSVFDIFNQTMENETFTQELQALGTAFDDKLDWTVGLYYLDEDGSYLEEIRASFANFYSGGRTTTSSEAVFVQGTYQFTDKLSVTAGLRYSEEEREYTPDTSVLDRPGPSMIPVGTRLLPATPAKTTAEEVTPMLNLSYQVADDLMLYATYSEGFKGGGFTQRVAEPQVIVPSFNPEFVTVYEAGVKFTGFDNRLRLNASVFASDYEDIQVIGAQPGALGAVTINAGEAEIKGFEVELTYMPMAGLLIQAGSGYLDAEYTSFSDAVADPEGSINNALPNTPEWSWSASVSYDIELDNGHRVTPRIDWSYQDAVAHDFDNEPELGQESYSLLSAALAFESADGAWLAVLSGKNLTNEEYLTSSNLTSGMSYGSYALPRTWAINVERRFD